MDYSSKDSVIEYLRSISEEKYKTFSKGLIPGEFEMIGVRIPTLKRIAKEISKGDYEAFLKIEDDDIFELKMLKGQVIANIKDKDEYEAQFFKYLPKITDWSLCDTFVASSKVISRNRERFFEIAKDLLKEKDEFKNRIAFVILLDYFVNDEYYKQIYSLIKGYESEYYYSNMALAWLISVLYVAYPSKTLQFLKKNRFSGEVIKYTIRKIKDSYRVSEDDKNALKELTKQK